jgi:hypothetical protein
MTKVVYNNCFGGFGLSHEACMLYAELKGITVYPETRTFGNTYWLNPPETRDEEKYEVLDFSEVDRTDPILVQVVEQLGKAANGDYSELIIKKLKEGTYYRIDEYDGNESVRTIDDYDWKKA